MHCMIHRKTSRLVCNREVKTTRATEYIFLKEYSTVQCAVCTVTVSYTAVIKKHGFDADRQYIAVVQIRGIRLGSTCPQPAGWYTDEKRI
jgi:hypothetical protein